MLKKFKKVKLSEAREFYESVEQINELSKKTLKSYVKKSLDTNDERSVSNLASKGGYELGQSQDDDYSAGEKSDAKSVKRSKGIVRALDKLTKEEVEQIDELSKKTLQSYQKKSITASQRASDKADKEEDKAMSIDGEKYPEKQEKHMKNAQDQIKTFRKRQSGLKVVDKKLGKYSKDTRPSWAKESVDMEDTKHTEVAASKTGEVLKTTKEKSTGETKPTGTCTHVVAGKTGEAYNTTPLTKRMPAVESAILDIMRQNVDLRQIHLESSHITIVSPEQRNDWMQVEQGKMPVLDYFNKYKV
jgi:septal ring factor EnvC (AmiA/AmiB activator)